MFDFFKENKILASLLGVWLLAGLWFAFVPITGYDAMKYHLPIINDIIQTHSLTFSVEIYNYNYLPVLGEIFYAVPMIIFGSFSSPYIFQLLQWSMLVLFLAVIYGFLKDKFKNKFLLIVSLLAIMSNMEFQREVMHGGYIDVCMFVLGITSVFIVIDMIWRKRIILSNLMISAVFLGVSLSMKYFALYFLGFNLLLLAGWYIYSKKIDYKTIGKYLFIILIICGFWYGKNLIVHQDPVYPMLKGVEFSQELGWWKADTRNAGTMLLFPYYRWGRWFTDNTESSSTVVILGFFAATYLLIPIILFLRKRFNFIDISLFFFTHFYLWIMFFLSHQERYLLISSIMIPVVMILFFDKICSLKFKKISAIIAIPVFLFMFAGYLHYFQYKLLYKVGIHTEQEYILNIGGL